MATCWALIGKEGNKTPGAQVNPGFFPNLSTATASVGEGKIRWPQPPPLLIFAHFPFLPYPLYNKEINKTSSERGRNQSPRWYQMLHLCSPWGRASVP